MLKAKTSTSDMRRASPVRISRDEAGLGSPSVTKIRMRRLPTSARKNARAWLTAAPKSVPKAVLVGKRIDPGLQLAIGCGICIPLR